MYNRAAQHSFAQGSRHKTRFPRFLTIWLCSCLLSVILGPAHALADAPRFFENAQDIPIMEGLTEIPEASLVFDNPEGRIVESVSALGNVPLDAAHRYYQETLVSFGWTPVGQNRFTRRNEQLEILFDVLNESKIMRIYIRPQ